MPFDDLLHDDDRSQAQGLANVATRQRGRQPSTEMNLRFKKANQQGHQYDPYSAFAFMEVKASAITLPGEDPENEAKGVYAVGRDVTERLRLEAQLRQAQKMEAVGTLAGGIAHDLNNILMGIQGYTSLVKSGFEQDSDIFKRLANIDEYVYSGAEMARQLLGFSQKSCHETCRMNLNYLLKMSAKMFGRTKKDIIISQDLEKKLWSTVVDEGQMKQVLMNLFVNAWQAMPNGGKISIKSENLEIEESLSREMGLPKAGAYIRISVSDTGVGMNKETQARIFDPFFTTKERGKGTGLGLATAYGIIKSHKGIFKVDSRPDQGSVFMFYLPATDTRTPKNTCAPAKSREGKLIVGKGRILLVDDEKGVIDVCTEMLETLGYEVVVAQSGFEAIDVVKDDQACIDLVILDMVMPEMNGFETYGEIQKINPDLRVLVCSGYSKEDEIQKMISKGCVDYLLKPFDVAMLSEKLQSVFNGGQTRENA
jgi:signal transduction histidine kinase/CheY-like chemotaxis protein